MNPNDEAFGAFLDDCRRRVEARLDFWLPSPAKAPERLHEAMRYAALGTGKRVRPILVYAAGRALNAETDVLDAPAVAVELMHAYSLVHDDLPAMDDDDLRRGRPTCHKAFDEATAILAGDALQTLAFRVLCDDPSLKVAHADRVKMVSALALAAGSRGMAGGQAMDMMANDQDTDLAQLENLHIHKTGALILASARLGALAAGAASSAEASALEHYAKCIGLAFQVRDDILDVEGETDTLGKTRGKDVAANKATYPALIGLDAAREMAQTLVAEALDSLARFSEDADPLRALARFITERER